MVDVSNKPQIVEHINKSLALTVYDTKWVPCSARFAERTVARIVRRSPGRAAQALWNKPRWPAGVGGPGNGLGGDLHAGIHTLYRLYLFHLCASHPLRARWSPVRGPRARAPARAHAPARSRPACWRSVKQHRPGLAREWRVAAQHGACAQRAVRAPGPSERR